MPQPQTGEQDPADEPTPPESLRPATEEPAEPTPDPRSADVPPTAPLPDPNKTPTAPAPAADELPKTAAESPRWSGSAPVPPAKPKKRRWPGAEECPPPPRREPTLELPLEEREPPESRTPVDPWADVDPFTPPLHPYPPLVPLPPTRSFPSTPSFPSPPPEPSPPAQPSPPGPQPAPPPPQLSAPRSPVASTPPPPLPPVRKPPKRARKRRQELSPPPPGWQAPPGYVPVPVRRRRRWPRIMTLLTVLTFACCCGCPGYFGKPVWEQYPASVAVQEEVADLTLRDDATSRQIVRRLEQETRTAHLLAEKTFAAVYGDPARKRVIIFGTTGFRLTPQSDLDKEMARLTENYRLSEVRPVETGIRGVHEQCGVGVADGTGVVVCAWADHGSLGGALFTRRSVEDSAALLGELRSALVARG